VNIHVRAPRYRRVRSYDDKKSITKSNSSIMNISITLSRYCTALLIANWEHWNSS